MIACRTSSWLQRCWPDLGKLDYRFGISDGPIFVTPDAGPTFPVLGHEDVEGGLWALLWLAPLILLSLAIIQTFWLNHPRRPLFSYDNLIALGRLGLCRPNQDLLPIELDHVHIHLEHLLVELHLGTFYKFQLSFIYGRLNLSMENIAIVSSMRIRIMSFTIRMLFEMSLQRYDMTIW
jgi:hypothetical protein